MGHNAILTGAPGQGKTSILQYLSYLAVTGYDVYGNKREKQAGIWRARRHDKYLEFFGLGIGKLMLPEGANYSIVKISGGDKIEEITVDTLEDEGIDYGFYTGPADLVDKLEVGKIFCVPFAGTSLEETEFYADLFEALVNRDSQKWIHVSIDEAGDILAPYNSDSYKVQKKFIDSVADFRKTLINSEFGCHSYVDLDHRIWPKLPYHIYKRGAKKMAGDTRKLKQETINGTAVEEAWFTYGTFFDKLIFPPMKPDSRLDYKLQTITRRFNVEKEDY